MDFLRFGTQEVGKEKGASGMGNRSFYMWLRYSQVFCYLFDYWEVGRAEMAEIKTRCVQDGCKTQLAAPRCGGEGSHQGALLHT